MLKYTTNNTFDFLVIMVMMVMVATAVAALLFVLSKKESHRVQVEFLQSFTEHFKPTLGIEKNLDYILQKTQELVASPNYSFYIFNPDNQHFTLKTVRQMTSDATIAPSYSGLLPYEKEKYDPPLSLSMDSLTAGTTLIKEGEVPILTVPIKGGKGLIRIGPVSKVPSKVIKQFEQINALLEVPLKNLIEEEDQRRRYEVLETSTKAVKYINHLYVHEVECIKLIMETCMKSAKPLSGLLLSVNSSTNKILLSYGMGKHVVQKANSDQNFITQLQKEIGEKPFSVIQNTAPQYAKLKQLFSIAGKGYLVLCQFSLGGKPYIILFSFDHAAREIENSRSQSIRMLWLQLQEFIKVKQNRKGGPTAYIDFLKLVADLIDQMSPFTIGSSKLMSNYSMVIAKEMGLSEYQIQSIGLAAYLSNIGVIGLSDGLVNKEGVYSDKEYEQMKLHSEVGASIIENMIAEEDVAMYLKHHHERMDGNGYPSRLMGDNIPIGSRIIAVVQTFLAKINGRNYRDPLPFEDALKLIHHSAGSQLDGKVVNVFLQWYEKRRKFLKGQNRGLGNCWDLCCVPLAICSTCPAYGKNQKNCWEIEKNNCLAHGKTCETCFVYTEAMSRNRLEKEAVV